MSSWEWGLAGSWAWTTTTKQLGSTLIGGRHLCKTADDTHEIITDSASPREHRIILVPNLLKKAALLYPQAIIVNIFAMHLIFPRFPEALCCSWQGTKIKSKILIWNCQLGFLAVSYRAKYHHCAENAKGGNWAIKEACKTLSSCRMLYLFSYWSCFSFFEK